MTATVSIVSTIRDEPFHRVQRMLDSIACQDGGHRLEVVIAAPASEHAELRKLRKANIETVVLVENPSGRRSPGLNAAVRAAHHPVCCRVDARSRIPPTYVADTSACLAADDRIGIVGGAQLPQAGGTGAVAQGIARSLANPYALGAPAYRQPGRTGPTETAYLGAFRRDDFLAIGGYNEALDANEDFELCARYRRAGYTVHLVDLPVAYEARTTLRSVFRQYEAFGRSKVRYWAITGDRPNARQRLAISAGCGGALVVGGLLATERRRLLPLGASSLVALAVVDHLGAGGPARPAERAVSCATYATVYLGWLKGIAFEWMRGA